MPSETTSLLTVPSGDAARSSGSTYSSIVRFFSGLFAPLSYRSFDIRGVCQRGDYKSLRDFVNTHEDKCWLKEMANRLYPSGPPLFYLIRVGRGRTRANHLACAQLLLKLGADACFHQPGAPRETLLREAIYSSTPEMAALLIKYGAKLDQELNMQDIPITEARPRLVAKIQALSQTSLDFIDQMKAADADYGNSFSFAKKNQ